MSLALQPQPRLVQPLGPWREPRAPRVREAPAKPPREGLSWSRAWHRAIYRKLDALAVGGTVEFSVRRFRRRPGSLADYYSRRSGRRVRSIATSRGVMFVRIE